jgi:hypothetical protein
MKAVLSSASDSNQAAVLYVLAMKHYRLLPRLSLSFKAKITLFYTEQAGPGEIASDLHSVIEAS